MSVHDVIKRKRYPFCHMRNVLYTLLKSVAQIRIITVIPSAMSRAFAQKPSDLTVNEGETAFFRCQSKRSRPPAKITWSMEGKNTDLTLNPRFVVLPSGILEIRSVMASDAGAYVCKATNEKRRKFSTAKAVLIVKRGLFTLVYLVILTLFSDIEA